LHDQLPGYNAASTHHDDRRSRGSGIRGDWCDSETTHSGNTPLNTLLIREHLRSPALFVPYATSKGSPFSAEAIANTGEHVGHSQKNSERNSRPTPVSC